MLPPNAQWLDEIGTLPKLVSAGIQYLGIKEIPGAKSNPVIMDMARSLGISDIYTNDDTAWCGLAISHLLRITAKPPLDYKGDRWNILRAKYYVNWGNAVPLDEAQLGDIGILERPGGGHVFIILAFSKDGKRVIGMGGNQNNSFSISEFDRERLIAVRRFYATTPPASAKQYFVDSTGKLSTNES